MNSGENDLKEVREDNEMAAKNEEIANLICAKCKKTFKDTSEYRAHNSKEHLIDE
jgi:uncharacterized C2H2 Zn-finger protein